MKHKTLMRLMTLFELQPTDASDEILENRAYPTWNSPEVIKAANARGNKVFATDGIIITHSHRDNLSSARSQHSPGNAREYWAYDAAGWARKV